MTEPVHNLTRSDTGRREGPGSPRGQGVQPGSFNAEILGLAEAARALSGRPGEPDETAMRAAVQRVEVATCMGSAGLREGLALAILVRVYLQDTRRRPRLTRAIGLLAAEILAAGGRDGV